MKLKSIYVGRQGFGADPDKLTGKIEFDNYQSTISMVLSEEQAAKIVNLVAEDSVRHAQELAGILIESVQSRLPSLMPPSGLTLLESVHTEKIRASDLDDEIPF